MGMRAFAGSGVTRDGSIAKPIDVQSLSYDEQAKLYAPKGVPTEEYAKPSYLPRTKAAQPQMVYPASAYPSKEALQQLSGGALLAMREQPGANQEYLGPIEHGAFTRDAVVNNELISGWPKTSGALMALSLAAATPVYSAAKNLGMMPRTRSSGSIEEIKQAYGGIYRGLKDLSR